MNEKICRGVVSERSDRVCERCGKEYAGEKHHRKNRSQAGSWEPANIIDLCRGCHGWVTEHPAESYAKGWSVRSTENSADVPVFYRGTWIRLDDLGNIHPADPIGA